MDNEEYEYIGDEYENVDYNVPKSHQPKIDDRNAVEKTGSTVKNTGKAVKKTGESVEKVGQNMQKAGDAFNKAGKTTENVGKGVENVGKGVETAGKASKAVGTVTDTAGKTTEAAGNALGAIPYAGAAFKVAGTAVGKTLEGVGTAEKVGGTVAEASGKATQVSGKGMQGAGKGAKGFGQGLKSAGKTTEDTGKKIKDTGEKIEEAGTKIEDTGKEINKFTKTTGAILKTTKNLWKYFIVILIIGCLLGITLLYNQIMSPISETAEGFKYYKNGVTNFLESVTNLYMGLGFRTNEAAFYNEMEKLYNKSNGKIDLILIISAISYPESENGNTTNYEEYNEEDNELFTEVANEYESEDQYTRGKISRLRKLGNKMIKSDESDEKILADYIEKQPEFDIYLNGLSDKEKENKIQAIIYEIYERKNWYTQIYGDLFDYSNAEAYSSTCVGGIARELANDEEKIGLPIIDNGFNYSFEGDYAYGIRDGVMHNGIDINGVTAGVSEGADVLAIADGEVISSAPNVSCNTRKDKSCKNSAGAWVRIKHSIVIDGTVYNFISVYMHLQTNSGQPKVGTMVNKGDKIGQIGNTGDSSGPHLHFEFRNDDGTTYGQAVDPINLFIKCSGKVELVGNTNEEQIWNYLLSLGYTKAGAAGVMGNWKAESGLFPNNLENGSNNKTGVSDEDFTKKVNNGTISREEFISSSIFGLYTEGRYGYGLAQWTAIDRKTKLYDYKLSLNTPIDDLAMQLGFYTQEAETYSRLNETLATATTPECAADQFHDIYEGSSDASTHKRQRHAKDIYDTYVNGGTTGIYNYCP